MIAKRFRLPPKEFPRRPKEKINSPYFSVKVSANTFNYNRYAVVISTRVDKRASQRNFWKRRIINYLKTLPDSNDDFLISVLPKIKDLRGENLLEEELDKVFAKT